MATLTPETRHAAGTRLEERLFLTFFGLYKTARLVSTDNATFIHQSEAFFKTLQSVADEYGDVTIKVVSGRYFVNEHMVRIDDRGQGGADQVIEEWKMLGIGGVTFRTDITFDEVRSFFAYMAGVQPKKASIEELGKEIAAQGWHKVQFLSRAQLGSAEVSLSEEQRKHIRQMARTTFFQAMTIVQDVVVSTLQEKEFSLSKTKRVVHALIDHIARDHSSLIELAAIKDYDDYTYAHSTNVCVYALTLGVRLGLDRPRLSQLGFTALFHDIGKVKLPQDLIRKPDSYDENDWIQMQRHPLLGAKTILRNMKFDMHTARAARGAFEHHINNDFTGYPLLRLEKYPVDLFSKIISVVDTFDALSSGRVYIKKSISPDEVLKKMRYQMHIKFDSFLLELFNDVIGIYPAGSMVLLTSNELALVLTNNDINKSRPYVKIVGNQEGLLESPQWIDLSLPEESHRKIVRLIDPARYGLDLKDFVLKD